MTLGCLNYLLINFIRTYIRFNSTEIFCYGGEAHAKSSATYYLDLIADEEETSISDSSLLFILELLY